LLKNLNLSLDLLSQLIIHAAKSFGIKLFKTVKALGFFINHNHFAIGGACLSAIAHRHFAFQRFAHGSVQGSLLKPRPACDACMAGLDYFLCLQKLTGSVRVDRVPFGVKNTAFGVDKIARLAQTILDDQI
jgi:hypothetical protein